MTTAITTSRFSRTADRPGPASASPFRSKQESTRYVAALAMIGKRQQEIKALTKALEQADTFKDQRRITTRLKACQNNLQAWDTYLEQQQPREPRAVVIPG